MASQLEILYIGNVTGGLQHGGTFDVSGVAFPQLKFLQVDTSFDLLPLVTRVAESSPLLEHLSIHELNTCYYDENQLDAVSMALQAAVTHMTHLTKLAVRTEYFADHLINLILSGDGSLAERLRELDVEVYSWEALHFVLAQCLNLRRLEFSLSFTLAQPDEWLRDFTGICNLKHLESFFLTGSSNYLVIISGFSSFSHTLPQFRNSARTDSSCGCEQSRLEGGPSTRCKHKPFRQYLYI